MINRYLTQKEIAYGNTKEELAMLMLQGFLAYEAPKHKDTIHRPVGIEIQLRDGTRKDTHSMSLSELMTFGNYISDRVISVGPDSLAFSVPAQSSKNMKPAHILNAKITLGDLMQMINDEYLFRKVC